MARKKIKKKAKGANINIKVDNIDRAIKEGRKWDEKNKKKWTCQRGCGGCWLFGSALAMILSYAKNTSIFWAVLHGIVSWIYVIYRIILQLIG